ncbi:MAG: hypothetical protein EA349_02885 [Halomonadaceae bacterium]|nr:MAG: hypothetical protein EA349_02885 [Halomonadaceae bacterium]
MKIFGVDHRPWPASLCVLALASGAALVVLMMINQYLITPDAPQGIISYQLAGDAESAKQIRRAWGSGGQLWAHLSLYLDFLFVALYLTFLLKLSNHLLLDRPGVREQQMGSVAKWLFIIGGSSDVAENVFLLIAIARPEAEDHWAIAAVVATLLKLTGLLLGAAALLIVRAARRHPLNSENAVTQDSERR